MSLGFFQSVCLPATCVYMYMHVWLLILSNSFKNHFQNTWWPHCWHVWKIDQDLVTFDDSKNKFFFSRWFQILRSRADLAHLDWARRGEPSQCQQLLLHDPIGQQPRPSPGEWESCPWERHGGSKGEVQAGPFWNSHSVWVEIRVVLKRWEGTSLSHHFFCTGARPTKPFCVKGQGFLHCRMLSLYCQVTKLQFHRIHVGTSYVYFLWHIYFSSLETNTDT